MAEFRWHTMADECPEFGDGDYVVLGLKGALYYANRYEPWGPNSLRMFFYLPNNRNPYMDSEKVRAWAKIPPFEEVGR